MWSGVRRGESKNTGGREIMRPGREMNTVGGGNNVGGKDLWVPELR